ncbi:MAG: DEAD/DEAH box helicase [Balneolaceae bacterium]|nr:DEAD/DEAH box helicase [Balneolaceae bacterium]
MNTFQELGLSAPIVEAVHQLGFEEPMPVQKEVIPTLLKQETDVVALAQTGTGKTAAFGLPLVQKTDPSINKPQALILSPTRELCIQITKDIKAFSQNQHKISTLAVYGGSSIGKQIGALNKGVQIIAATPGRLLDLLRRGKIDTSAIKTVVLDEADELLNMGFQNDLNAIFDTLPKHYKTWLFSATMPNSVEHIANRYMDNPIRKTVGTRNAGADNVTHKYVSVASRDRYEALTRIIDMNPDMYGIVFCRTRRDTEEVARKLANDGYKADYINGDLSQSQRDSVMNKFRTRHIRLMVATDVASRGIDVDDLTHVINYQIPDDLESYTHRSGRTGRAGKEGISIAISQNNEKGKIRQLEKTIKQKFNYVQVPSKADVQQLQMSEWVERVKQTNANNDHVDEIMPKIIEEFAELSREELIRQFLALEFKNGIEKPAQNNGQASSSDEHNNLPESGYERFFINIGKKHNLNPGQLIGLINEQTRSGSIDIGKIDLMGSFSFFEADVRHADTILDSFKSNASFQGNSVRVEIAKPDSDGSSGSGRKKGRRKPANAY